MDLKRNFVFTAFGLLVFALGLPGVAAAADDARGRALYDLCAQCHGENGGGMKLALAPAIAGLDQWYIESQLKMFKSGARGTNPDDVGGMRMHPMSMWLRGDEDVTAVASYVSSLPATHPTPIVSGGNAEKGGSYYQACAACHGAEGKGDQTKNSPQLAGLSDWYLLESLQKYKAGIRGANQQNPNAILMRGMSNMLADDQAMRDVVAYIVTLDK
jgi:cytochrome c oxidase subunit 2